MHTVLEHQRKQHEQIDRLENLAASLLLDVPRTHKHRLALHTRVATLAKQVVSTSASLLDTYASPARAADLDRMAGDHALADFYARLRDVHEFHDRNPDEAEIVPMELELMDPNIKPDDPNVLESGFSGEEFFGRFIDLHTHHETYVNLLRSKASPATTPATATAAGTLSSLLTLSLDDDPTPKLTYLEYLDTFHRLASVPRELKNAAYKSYLASLLEYLQAFIARSHPLFDYGALESAAHDAFSQLWSARADPAGWCEWIDTCATPDVFCDACGKQFHARAMYERHVKGDKRHKKAARALEGKSQDEVAAARQAKRREFESEWFQVAWSEYLVECIVDQHLRGVVQATRDNVERKQTLTEAELAAELEALDQMLVVADADHDRGDLGDRTPGDLDQDAGDDHGDDDDDDDEKIYNPLKLPLGWDGKPIPYWLYKLHGLGVEYPCEICGGYVYMGRKAFERHFQEFRHAMGMKSLGVPNNKQFQEITKIEDALSLWDKLKASQNKGTFRADVDAEFEDSEGNVMSRKVYEDLQRQGLL
ncbi:hypothetical protein BCR44DRAFT_35523 [Catenaria anguillulae PL171]|uniref:Matrin-type domain-containing protein n=1 Tax=Catenaria anguillulae PL171 TaxID=765915 RepID=A0A1Y2HGF6_9FUNG|nr:hypothetical protein BCR44DRAFT_35523 [Catenaria anguillulae PL171]